MSKVAERVAYRQALVEETANAADVLKRFISTCRAEGMGWNEISSTIDVPAYCVRVIAGDTRKNRVLPEFHHQAK